MTISKDRVKPSPMPDSWKLKEIFATGVVLGGYLALMTVLFFWAMKSTDFFSVGTKFFGFKNIKMYSPMITLCKFYRFNLFICFLHAE